MSYYISSGKNNQMYTLRHKFSVDSVDSVNTHQYDHYICTLSKFPELAVKKANEYVSELGYNPAEFKFNANFVLDEHNTGGHSCTWEISQKTMVSGKHEGVKVEDLPMSYIKWCYSNMHYGINYEIICNYVKEFDLLEGWINEASLNVYNTLQEKRIELLDRMKNKVLVFGNKSYTQRLNEKTFDKMKKIVKEGKDQLNFKCKKDYTTGKYSVNLVEAYVETGYKLQYNNDVDNYIVAYHICAVYDKQKELSIDEISLDHIIDVMTNNPNARKFIME